MMNFKTLCLAGAISTSLMASSAFAQTYMPFILGTTSATSVAAAVDQAKTNLVANGFDIVGEYSPMSETQVIVVTNANLKELAANSENGAFGAMEKVSVVNKGGKVEVSYTNPAYQYNAYRMKGDIMPIQAAMEKALGNAKSFGADEGLSADDLRDYHYKMMMPYFDDTDKLETYGSHEEAIKQIEAGLAAKKAGVSKVYRIDIPGTKMSVFGVNFSEGEGADKNILTQIDTGSDSHAAHFPYEVVVVDNKAIALNGKFRIAISWPSLSMMGSGSFMSIANAPDVIKESLEKVAEK